MLPPTRTGAGGGGGGGASGRPPTTPPSEPPGTPPTTPPGTPTDGGAGGAASGLISAGASTGAALGLTLLGVGVGGGGADTANAIITGGVGRMSAASNGTMITPPTSRTCRKMDTGTVYQACDPTLIDGSTTSPNRSFGTDLASSENARSALDSR